MLEVRLSPFNSIGSFGFKMFLFLSELKELFVGADGVWAVDYPLKNHPKVNGPVVPIVLKGELSNILLHSPDFSCLPQK